MNIFELMESCKKNFSSTDARIYELIRKWPDDFSNKKINMIVEKFGVSQAALTRFAKRLGFDGFNVFQYQFKADLDRTSNNILPSSNYYSDYLPEVERSIHLDQLNTIVSHILSCQNLILAGCNLSSLPAKYLQYFMNFASIKPCFFYNPIDGMIPSTKKDVFILFSVNSGLAYKDYLKNTQSKADQPYKILVTFSKKHSLSKYFDEVVILPESHLNQTKNTVLPDTFAFFLFCNALVQKFDIPNLKE